jgi:anti-sigma factor RsiW
MPPREELQATIEAYLLGRLSAEEQTRIEALLFEDPDALDFFRDSEDDLIDRYLAGELSAHDRAAFEQAFATSTSRRERIAFARALAESLADGAEVDEPMAATGTATGGRGWLSSGRRVVLPTGAAIAVALLVGLVVRSRVKTPEDGAASPVLPAPLTPAPSPSARQGQGIPSDTATIVLQAAEMRRSAGTLPRLRVPDGTAHVRLLPQIEASEGRGPYAATLRRVEGPVVWRGTTSAVVEGGRTSVTIPATSLTAGDYVLSLARPRARQDDALEYPFRISTGSDAGAAPVGTDPPPSPPSLSPPGAKR